MFIKYQTDALPCWFYVSLHLRKLSLLLWLGYTFHSWWELAGDEEQWHVIVVFLLHTIRIHGVLRITHSGISLRYRGRSPTTPDIRMGVLNFSSSPDCLNAPQTSTHLKLFIYNLPASPQQTSSRVYSESLSAQTVMRYVRYAMPCQVKTRQQQWTEERKIRKNIEKNERRRDDDEEEASWRRKKNMKEKCQKFFVSIKIFFKTGNMIWCKLINEVLQFFFSFSFSFPCYFAFFI